MNDGQYPHEPSAILALPAVHVCLTQVLPSLVSNPTPHDEHLPSIEAIWVDGQLKHYLPSADTDV